MGSLLILPEAVWDDGEGEAAAAAQEEEEEAMTVVPYGQQEGAHGFGAHGEYRYNFRGELQHEDSFEEGECGGHERLNCYGEGEQEGCMRDCVACCWECRERHKSQLVVRNPLVPSLSWFRRGLLLPPRDRDDEKVVCHGTKPFCHKQECPHCKFEHMDPRRAAYLSLDYACAFPDCTICTARRAAERNHRRVQGSVAHCEGAPPFCQRPGCSFCGARCFGLGRRCGFDDCPHCADAPRVSPPQPPSPPPSPPPPRPLRLSTRAAFSFEEIEALDARIERVVERRLAEHEQSKPHGVFTAHQFREVFDLVRLEVNARQVAQWGVWPALLLVALLAAAWPPLFALLLR